MPKSTTALFLSVDEEKHINIERVRANLGPKEMEASLKQHRAKDNIIVAAHPSLVATSTIPVHIERLNKELPLTAVELENVLSKAIAQAFNQCRANASRELQVDDLNTVLVNSQVIHFKVDGHQVLNPTGFKVRTIEAAMELTMTTRDVYTRVRTLLSAQASFFFTEHGRAAMNNLAKLRLLPITLVVLGQGRSTYFIMQKVAIGTRTERADLIWHSSKFRELLMTEFGVNERAAREMYALYLAKNLSPVAFKYFDKVLKPGLQSLLAELKIAKFKGEIFLSCDEFLPTELPVKYGSFTLGEPPVDELLSMLGVEADLRQWGRTRGQALLRLAPFLQFYFAKNNSQVNEWLKRHLNWLGASV